ncbi:hypothetical protein CDD81_1918 [Ophiocordyceps australis]|uniref:Uncharacterized protein n=1 Tax=Ophiocordyceps australis TaxID=1399860 RepID=A0A2C5X7V5_9HYPO|nr:hypothetical protein CDD81_1918 [Ophiocordyceps australis]
MAAVSSSPCYTINSTPSKAPDRAPVTNVLRPVAAAADPLATKSNGLPPPLPGRSVCCGPPPFVDDATDVGVSSGWRGLVEAVVGVSVPMLDNCAVLVDSSVALVEEASKPEVLVATVVDMDPDMVDVLVRRVCGSVVDTGLLVDVSTVLGLDATGASVLPGMPVADVVLTKVAVGKGVFWEKPLDADAGVRVTVIVVVSAPSVPQSAFKSDPSCAWLIKALLAKLTWLHDA